MKLPNGCGSITKLKGKRRNPYIVRITLGYKDDGTQIRKSIGYAPNSFKAMEILTDYFKNTFNIEYKDLTFKEVFEKWLPTQEKLVEQKLLSKSSITSYKNAFYNHCEKLHNKLLVNIKKNDIQDIVDQMTGSETLKKYVRHLCSKLFKFADEELDMPIKKNYALNVNIISEKKSTKHKAFENHEIQILWENISKFENIDTILIMIYTSLRPSELLNIKKENINLKEKYLIGGGKTKAGTDRIIPIHDKIYNLIKNRYEKSQNYLIERNNNKITYRYYLEYIWNPIIKSLGLNNTPHDCRHTFATKMDNANANKICTKLIIGHAIPDITDGIYTHKTLEDLRKEINKIN